MNVAKFLWTLPFLTFCFGGLTVQVVYLTTEYFQYKSQPRVEIAFPHEVSTPFVSFCSRIIELIDTKKRKTYKLRNKFNRSSENSELREELFTTMTLAQLFDMTPSPEEVITSCKVRPPGSHPKALIMEDLDREKCYRMLTVTRYYMQQYMCYKAGINSGEKYQFEWLAQADRSVAMPYIIYFNRTLLGRSRYVSVIVNGKDTPDLSRYYSNIQKLAQLPNEQFFQHNDMLYTYSGFHYNLLPVPYDTACGLNHFDGQLWKQAHCKKRCMLTNVQNQLHFIPYNHIIAYNDELANLDLKLLSNFVLRNNESLLREYVEIVADCDRQCSLPTCNLEFFDTEFIEAQQNPRNNVIIIKILLPLHPTTSFEHIPVYSINDYVMLLMACLGTWLGVSMIDFNPVKLFFRYRDRNRSGIAGLRRRMMRHEGSIVRNDRKVDRLERTVQQLFVLMAKQRSYRRPFNPGRRFESQ